MLSIFHKLKIILFYFIGAFVFEEKLLYNLKKHLQSLTFLNLNVLLKLCAWKQEEGTLKQG